MPSVLPKTRVGTWAAAFAVWAAGVLVTRASLPVVPRAAWPSPGGKHVIGFLPGRHTLVTCEARRLPHDGRSTEGPVRFWDPETGEVGEWFGPEVGIDPYTSAISPDGRWVAVSVFRDNSRFGLTLVDTRAGPPGTELPVSTSDQVAGVCFSAGGRRLAYYDSVAGRVRVWDINTKQVYASLPLSGRRLALSPDGRTLAACIDPDAALRLWDVATGSPLRAMAGPANAVCWGVAFSGDGRAVWANFSTDACAHAWGWATDDGAALVRADCLDVALPAGEAGLLTVEVGATGEAEAVARDPVGSERGRVGLVPDFSYRTGWLGPDGRTVAVDVPARNVFADWLARRGLRWFRRERSTQVQLLDAVTGGEIGRLPVEPAPPHDNSSTVQVSHDGRVMAVADERGVTVWDVPPRKPFARFVLWAAVLAVPAATVAAWRVRRLNRVAAAGGGVMRLLPQDRRWMCLLAGAAWAGCCAVAWWVMPVVPRAECLLPGPGVPACFLPGPTLVTADTLVGKRRGGEGTGWVSAGPLRTFDAGSGRMVRAFDLPDGCELDAARTSGTGRWVALLRRQPGRTALWLLDAADGTVVRPPGDAAAGVSECAFGPEDRVLLCATDAGVYRLAVPGLAPDGPPTPRVDPLAVSRIALAGDGRAVATWDGSGESVRVWAGHKLLAAMPRPPAWDVWGLGLSHRGGTLAAYEVTASSVDGDRAVRVEGRCWEVATGRELLRAAGPPLASNVPVPAAVGPLVACLSPGGQTLALLRGPADPGRGDYGITLWDVPSGSPRGHLDVPPGALGEPLRSALLSPDGRTAVMPLRWPRPKVADYVEWLGIKWLFDRRPFARGAALFDAATLAPLGRVPGHLGNAVWSADGTMLAVPQDDGRTVCVWDVPPRKPLWWFVPVAAILAVPPAWWVRRRCRRPGRVA